MRLGLCFHSTPGTREIFSDHSSLGCSSQGQRPVTALPSWSQGRLRFLGLFSEQPHPFIYLELRGNWPSWGTSTHGLENHYAKVTAGIIGFPIYCFRIWIFNNYQWFLTLEPLVPGQVFQSDTPAPSLEVVTFALVRLFSVFPGPRLFEGKLLIT